MTTADGGGWRGVVLYWFAIGKTQVGCSRVLVGVVHDEDARKTWERVSTGAVGVTSCGVRPSSGKSCDSRLCSIRHFFVSQLSSQASSFLLQKYTQQRRYRRPQALRTTLCPRRVSRQPQIRRSPVCTAALPRRRPLKSRSRSSPSQSRNLLYPRQTESGC